jgi:hypothetical protein
MIITYVPLQRWMGLTKGRLKISFGKILFHLTIIAMASPFIVFTVIDNLGTKMAFDRDVTRLIELKAQHIEEEIITWEQTELRALRLNP